LETAALPIELLAYGFVAVSEQEALRMLAERARFSDQRVSKTVNFLYGDGEPLPTRLPGPEIAPNWRITGLF
jgi:hypothetical protein